MFLSTCLLFVFVSGFVAQPALAQVINITEGISKVQKNLQTAESNLKTSEEQKKILQNHLGRIKNRADNLTQQKTEIQNDLKRNVEQIKKLAAQENSITKWMTQEEKLLQQENQQTQQLQDLLQKIEQNRALRSQLIEGYRQQLMINKESQKQWQLRSSQLQQQNEQTAKLLREAINENEQWTSEKNKVDQNLKNWQSKTVHYKRINSTLKSLYENQ